MHLPSLKQLQYLVALADCGSFSDAAEQCHVTQPTLSAGIAALESLLGKGLVDRTNRNVLLTPLGEETVHKARAILLDSQNLVERALYASDPLAGPLRLGIIPTIAPYILPCILPALREAFPKLELQLHEDLSPRLTERMQEGALDLLLMALPYPTEDMIQHPLFSEPFYLAAYKGHWQKRLPIRLNDLEGERLLLLEEGHCLRDHALAACKLQPTGDSRNFSATSLPTLIELVKNDFGITLLPEMVVKANVLPETVECLPFEKGTAGREIGLIWRKGSPREDAFRTIGKTIAETAGRTGS